MQKLVLAMLLLFVCAGAYSQDSSDVNDADTVPGYKKKTTIPDFAIIQPDSSWFTNKQIPAKKPVVIIYFSPDCGHCQITAREFVEEMDKLKDVELIWVSFHTPQQIKEFAETYKLNQFSNVVLGRDPNYFFVPFYKIEVTPFMAVYDKKGKFLQAYKSGTDAQTIARLIKNFK